MSKSKSYGAPEPTVIDEELIRASLREADQIALEYDEVPANPPYHLSNVPKLSLSFRNLYSSANLSSLVGLVELRLDNNRITKIEGLSELRNLTWLDLSFNSITAIEGLETLTKLTDLSLYNNKISSVSGLSSLLQLESLSLGNNKLESLSTLAPLRVHKNMKSLNLSGNPLSQLRDYRLFCIAYFKPLVFLDYVMIEASEIQNAKELASQTEELVDITEKDASVAFHAVEEKARADAMAALLNANIAHAETLFDEVMKEDADLAKLRLLPGMQQVVDEYRSCFRELVEDFKVKAFDANKAINAEVASFTSAVAEISEEAAQESIELVRLFQKQRKGLMKEFIAGRSSDLSTLKLAAESLNKSLQTVELRANEQIEELFDMFESNLNELRLAKLLVHQFFFRGMESFEAKCNDSLLGAAERILRQAVEDPSSFEHLSEDMIQFTRDRESLVSTITGTHDFRVSFIIGKEDAMTSAENKRCLALSKEPRLQERKRNRDKMLEIQLMVSNILKEIRDAESGMDDEDED